MIPPFNDAGLLPPGIHPATLAEIAGRFGGESELRRVQMDSVRWMIDLAVRAGVLRIVLNGSFVTDIMEPNDVDCVLLVPAGRPRDIAAFRELRAGLQRRRVLPLRSPSRQMSSVGEPSPGGGRTLAAARAGRSARPPRCPAGP